MTTHPAPNGSDWYEPAVATDPLTRALTAAVTDAVGRALDARLPRVAVTTAEAAEMLGVSVATVGRMLRAGELRRLRCEAQVGVVTVESIYAVAGWPVVPITTGLSVVA